MVREIDYSFGRGNINGDIITPAVFRKFHFCLEFCKMLNFKVRNSNFSFFLGIRIIN